MATADTVAAMPNATMIVDENMLVNAFVDSKRFGGQVIERIDDFQDAKHGKVPS